MAAQDKNRRKRFLWILLGIIAIGALCIVAALAAGFQVSSPLLQALFGGGGGGTAAGSSGTGAGADEADEAGGGGGNDGGGGSAGGASCFLNIICFDASASSADEDNVEHEEEVGVTPPAP